MSRMVLDEDNRDDALWDAVGTLRENGTAMVALMVRYPDGVTCPVSVPTGTTARDFAVIIADVMGDGYKVRGVVAHDN